jgi:hypothetical protein
VDAGGVHAVKATARPPGNVTTAGVGAPVVSTAEDVLAVIGTVLALLVPILAAVLIVAAVIVAIVFIRCRHRRVGGAPSTS